MSSTQHRCVFVGNIPYDATEEQLVRICEEVGPVVSFRLVIDKETGKPKGYGFCEYKDEETALSARRNLQGYEINGRQLRVDFAENEKGSADRNREQGRGGPGFIDISKQTGGSNTLRDLFLYQPVGLPAAVSAAAVMTGLLGAPQMSVGSNAAGGAGRAPPGIDALTVHLASMSMHQLCEVLHLVKNFIQQNQQQARQVLTANPQLVKALFQAQIIVGRVPQVPAQMSHTQSMSQSHVMPPQLGQAQIPSGGQLQPQSQGVQQSQVQRSQNFPFQLPSHPHQQLNAKTPAMPLPPQTLLPPPPSSSSLPSQSLAMQRSQSQPPLPMNPPPLPHQPRPLLPSSLQQAQIAQGAGFQHPLSQQAHLSQIQQPSGMPPTNAGLPYQGAPPPLPYQPPLRHHVQMPRTGGDLGGNAGIGQGGLPSSAGLLDASTSASLGGTSQLGRRPGTEKLISSTPFLNQDQLPSSSRSMIGVPLETSSMVAMSMAMGPGYSSVGASASKQQGVISRSAPSEGPGMMYAQEHSQPVMQPLRQQEPQVSLELEQQKALLQQVMNLTPEQISSLPPEQRQQVLDLQQAFRNQLI